MTLNGVAFDTAVLDRLVLLAIIIHIMRDSLDNANVRARG